MARAANQRARTQEIFEDLRARILSDQLPAGSRLPPERDLAQELETNRNTLREAIRRLQQLGLLTQQHGYGVTVRDFRSHGSIELLGAFLQHGRDPAEVMKALLDVLEPRVHMVEQLMVMAAKRAQPEDLEALDQAIVHLLKAEREKDAEAHAAGQLAWLEALLDATHNMPLRWTANPFFRALGDVLTRRPELIVFQPSYATYATTVRGAILEHDVEAAVSATRSFFAAVDEQVRAMLEPFLQEVG